MVQHGFNGRCSGKHLPNRWPLMALCFCQNEKCVQKPNWFSDREIPRGGHVRILAESLLWEERLGKTRRRTTEGLTTCMKPRRGWTIASSSWNFLRKRWADREQELITVIQEETKLTEEKEEAGYRSPTMSFRAK